MRVQRFAQAAAQSARLSTVKPSGSVSFLWAVIRLFRAPVSPTFEQIAREVLLEKQLSSNETKKAATRQLNRLIRNFGSLPIAEVTECLWIQYVLRERSIKDRTFFDDRKYMRIVLGAALRRNLIGAPPRLPIPDLPWDAGRELTQRELKALREAAAKPSADVQGREGDNNQKSVDLLFQIDIGWKMGLRLREMLFLRWDQFNWEQRTIRLRAGDVKTRVGREIPVNPDLWPEFQARFNRAASQFVFPSRIEGRPVSNNKTAWRRCRREAGVDCRWHDLRGTCATLMLRAGVPRHVVKDYLGMSEPVLDSIYAHLTMDDKRLAALVMTEAVKPVGVDDLWKAARALSG